MYEDFSLDDYIVYRMRLLPPVGFKGARVSVRNTYTGKLRIYPYPYEASGGPDGWFKTLTGTQNAEVLKERQYNYIVLVSK